MPANCETCPFVNTNSILFYCRANVNDVKVYSMDNVGKRQADCPLVLVDKDNDLISRQKALKTILEQPPEVHYPSWSAGQIRAMSPVQSEKGRWIRHNTYYGDDTSGFIDPDWRCSKCGKSAIINAWMFYDLSNFCPNCGADMRGEEDEQFNFKTDSV